MQRNFKCPKCKTQQSIGKKLHASWTCPKCHFKLIPTREIRALGYVPFKFNAMVAEMRAHRR